MNTKYQMDGYSDDFALHLQRLTRKLPPAQAPTEKPKVRLASKKRKVS
jgi:hypothetical protein